jgi:hypothetical protein
VGAEFAQDGFEEGVESVVGAVEDAGVKSEGAKEGGDLFALSGGRERVQSLEELGRTEVLEQTFGRLLLFWEERKQSCLTLRVLRDLIYHLWSYYAAQWWSYE